MAGDSLLKDVAEVLEFYGADRDVPSLVLARFLVECLTAFQKAQILAHPVAEAPADRLKSAMTEIREMREANERADAIAEAEKETR